MFVLSRVDDAQAHEEEIRALVKHENTHFNPPLSTRSGTVDRNLNETNEEDITRFVQSILDEPTILAHHEDTNELVGLLSYREHYTNDALLAYQPAHHISLVLVHDNYADTDLYATLVAEVITLFESSDDIQFITTRLADTHIDRLETLEHALGFTCVNRMRNDRPDNVDTMWFAYQFDSQ